MNQLANELNKAVISANTNIFEMLSEMGKKLFFPKGILSQAAEARNKADKINATIGIAKENGKTMCIDSIISNITQIKPRDALTYASSFGLTSLRQAWQRSLYEKNNTMLGKNISLPIVTCGITHAISTFADIWLDPKDVVILPNMTWGNYNMILSVRKNVRLSQYPIFSKNGRFNLEEFSNKLNQESKKNNKITVLLNFPHNPSGYSLNKEEAAQIVHILIKTAEKGTRVIAVCDDAYFGLTYENDIFKESLFSILCNGHEKLLAVKLDGATKEDFSWGLRIGFITYGCLTSNKNTKIYDALETKTAGCIRGTISNASHLSQTLLLKSLNNESSIIEKNEKFKILKVRAQTIKKILENKKFFEVWKPYPFNSGYFMCLKLKTVNANELRMHLLEKYGIGLIAIDTKNIRIAFSCIEASKLNELFETIFQGINDLACRHQK